MGMSVLSGAIKNIQNSTETHGHISDGRGRISSNAVTTFRIDNKPVTFKTKTAANFSDGDKVSAAGFEKNGEFNALAVKNSTTNALYTSASDILLIILGTLLVLVSIPIMFLLVGFLTAPLGGLIIFYGIRIKKAKALLISKRTPEKIPAEKAKKSFNSKNKAKPKASTKKKTEPKASTKKKTEPKASAKKKTGPKASTKKKTEPKASTKKKTAKVKK